MVYKYLLVQINSSDLFLWVGFIYCVKFKKKKKSFMALFYGWDSTASRLQSHCEEALYFLPLSYHRSWVSQKNCCQLFFNSHVLIANSGVMFCAIWYHLYNLKSMKNTYAGVFFWFTKSNTPPRKTSLSHLCIEHRWFEKGMGYASP